MLPLNPPLTDGARPSLTNPARPYAEEAFQAFDRSSGDAASRIHFARHVLERDPENLWAMSTVAAGAATEVEGMALLREAVRVGLRLWAPALRGSQPAPDWGRDEDTIPFLGCVLAYGLALHEMAHHGEAAQCLRFLLKLDPLDSLGAERIMASAGVQTEVGTAPGGRRM